MALRNPARIVRQIILTYSFILNLVLMNFRYKFVYTVFSLAAFCVLISSTTYIAIALFCLMVTIFLPVAQTLTRNYFTRQEDGMKKAVVLASLLVFCSILPQVETNTAVFTSPIENFKNNQQS